MELFRLSCKQIARPGILLCASLLPKNPRRMVFASKPDFADNARALYRYVQQQDGWECSWIVADSATAQRLQSAAVAAYSRRSLRGLWKVLTARYLVTTHLHFLDWKSRGQILVNLWHGIPLKSMGLLDSRNRGRVSPVYRRLQRRTDIFTASSSLMRYTLAACFGLDPRKVRVTGQPRSDALYSTSGESPLSRVLPDTGSRLPLHTTRLLYAPTFRQGLNDRSEGDPLPTDTLVRIPGYSAAELQRFLERNSAVLYIKLHPVEEQSYREQLAHFRGSDRIVLLRTGDFASAELAVTNILPDIDVLITDYSSVYMDYLHLDRPIVFIDSDRAEYTDTRGLLFEDYDFWTPGPKAATCAVLLQQLQQIIEHDEYAPQRGQVHRLVHRFSDDRNAARVYSAMTERGTA